MKRCSVENCELPFKAKGLCDPHYKRIRRTGDVMKDKPIQDRSYVGMSFEEALWSRVNKNGPLPDFKPELGPCWIWQGYTNNDGYGVLQRNYKQRHTHRIVYEIINGEVPKGLFLDHLCRVISCCNPDHLEPVTPSENFMRGFG